MLLVLDWAEKYRILQVHHFRHAASLGTKQLPLRGSRTINHLLGSAEVFPQQISLGSKVGPLRMGGQHSILDVHARIKAQFANFAQDGGVVGGLLSVLGHQHRPAGVERCIKVIMSAMDIERMLGEGARANLQDHRRKLSRSMIVLLHGIDDSLTGGKIDRAAAGHRICRSPSLSGVLAFAFNRNLLLPKDIQLPLSIGLLVNLASLGGRSNRIEDTAFGNASFNVLGDQLVAAARYSDTGIFRLGTGRLGLLRLSAGNSG